MYNAIPMQSTCATIAALLDIEAWEEVGDAL